MAACCLQVQKGTPSQLLAAWEADCDKQRAAPASAAPKRFRMGQQLPSVVLKLQDQRGDQVAFRMGGGSSACALLSTRHLAGQACLPTTPSKCGQQQSVPALDQAPPPFPGPNALCLAPRCFTAATQLQKALELSACITAGGSQLEVSSLQSPDTKLQLDPNTSSVTISGLRYGLPSCPLHQQSFATLHARQACGCRPAALPLLGGGWRLSRAAVRMCALQSAVHAHRHPPPTNKPLPPVRMQLPSARPAGPGPRHCSAELELPGPARPGDTQGTRTRSIRGCDRGGSWRQPCSADKIANPICMCSSAGTHRG